MTLKRALSLDMICWIALLISVWLGPQWVIKVALSIMIVWNGLCVSYLAKQNRNISGCDCVPDYPIDGNFN